MATVKKIRINFAKRTIPRRGPFSTSEYSASMEELSVDLIDFGARWNTDLYPLLNSLPRGEDETRWASATNVPEPIVDGLDGDNMFVDNSATTTVDDGLFWNSTELRPKTIRESSRDLDSRITSVYSELSETVLGLSNGLSAEQWNRLGAWVKDGTSSLTTSVSYKARTGWDRLHTLMTDVFESGLTDLGSLGTSGFTLEEMITNLLDIHGGTWDTDTSSINHSTITGVTQVSCDASASYDKRARGSSPDANNLEEDLNRLRYEIARTRVGAAVTASTGQWNEDVTDPVDSGVACISDHVGYAGNGTQDANNPHGLHRQDIDGLDTEFGYNNTFTGKTGLGSETPSYSSTVVVTASASLETAIGELDAELAESNGFIGKGLADANPTYSSVNIVTQSTNLEAAVGELDAEAGYVLSFLGKAAGSNLPNYGSPTYVTNTNTLETAITDIDTELGYIGTFLGKAAGSDSPSYSSSTYATGDLETAIGALDTQLTTVSSDLSTAETSLANHIANTSNPHSVTTLQIGAAVREVYSFSAHTDSTAPIVINHNKGTAGVSEATWPLVQVVDTLTGGDYGVLADEVYGYEQEHGIVTADAFVSIEYIDNDTFHVYTNLTAGKIIAVF